MRKKSHISLAGQMMNFMDTGRTIDHRLTFYLANILPDCKPSFLTTPHTFDDTFEKIGEKMRKLVRGFEDAKGMTMRKTICLGEVTHYVADYFTFPHNSHYDGNLKDHCCYEGDLKRRLKEYIQSGQAMILKSRVKIFARLEDLLDYIKECHREYMSRKRSIQEDMDYIITVCTTVLSSLMQMCLCVQENQMKKAGYAFVS